jgi:hypothetical protein
MNNRISISVLEKKGDTSLFLEGEGFVQQELLQLVVTDTPTRHFVLPRKACAFCLRVMGCWV